jgi:GntR family transcriptional regulator
MKTLQISQILIDKSIPIPYYYQIVEALRNAIEESAKKYEDEPITLPSEPELSELFSVNRGTIRHALQVLENEGFIRKEKGRGTFVRRMRLQMDLSYLQSTTEEIKRRGWRPKTELIGIRKIKPNERVREILQLDEPVLVWEVLRVHSANNEPISVQRAMVPIKLMPDLDSKNLEDSLYKIWNTEYQIFADRGEQTIRTRLPLDDEMRLLQIEKESPVFEITRVTYSQQDIPIEYLKSIWRGDRYDFFVNLSSDIPHR